METSSVATADAHQYEPPYAAPVDSQRKKLELKLNTGNEKLCSYDPPSPCYSNPTDSEPPSPDSGFSSDENVSPLSRSNWATHDEVAATYGHTVFGADNVDAFVFSMMLPAGVKEGQCQFCVRFSVNGQEFWDNNSGKNYCVDIVPDASLPPSYERCPVPTMTPAVTTFFTPRRLRRWGRAQEESDDESSRVYIPRRRAVL
ncbi:putative phosphatase regulatory subunit [Ostertagia ostertagi]